MSIECLPRCPMRSWHVVSCNADVPRLPRSPDLTTINPRTMQGLKASIQNGIASILIGMLKWATQNTKIQLQESSPKKKDI